ncbi:MAG: hypothetical protein WC476_08790 [Phycisphaerae bacterium]|jgi:hypothetical protein
MDGLTNRYSIFKRGTGEAMMTTDSEIEEAHMRIGKIVQDQVERDRLFDLADSKYYAYSKRDELTLLHWIEDILLMGIPSKKIEEVESISLIRTLVAIDKALTTMGRAIDLIGKRGKER